MSAEVTRWTRYGKDRLYVSTAAGGKVGWVDLLTDEEHPEAPERAAELTTAVAGWRATHPAVSDVVPAALSKDQQTLPQQRPGPRPAPMTTQRPPPPSAPAAALPAEPAATGAVPDAHPHPVPDVAEDLASRRAGAMAREQAVALKQAAPVRTLLARALGVHTDERAWRIGADGEEKVAVQLAKLASKDPRWHFLHAVPVGENGADIDHVVIGPGGVFTLNAKHHPGAKIWVGGNTLMVNGQRQPYLRNSAHEARRASRMLTAACGFPVVATGVVVPVGADDVVIKTQPTEVHVVYRRALVGWLRERPAVLPDATIEAVFAAARRSTTWVPSGR